MQRFRSAKSGKAEYSSPDSSAPNHDPEKTNSNNDNIEEEANLQRQNTRSSHRKSPRWWRIYWFRGMFQDVKRRAPFYLSDWLDAWDYRVVPATVYMFFAKYVETSSFYFCFLRLELLRKGSTSVQRQAERRWCSKVKDRSHCIRKGLRNLEVNVYDSLLPALAFSLDMFDRTQMSYGVNEVLLSTVLAAVVFSLFAAQPLTIVGVTGKIRPLRNDVEPII